MAAADYIQVAQQLYLAYFGRPADRSGLINMTNALNAAGAPTDAAGIAEAYSHKTNATVVAILNNFAASDESKALYGPSTDGNAKFIAAVYAQVLNRVPDLEGLDFWTAALDSGALTRANAASQIIAAALKDGGDATDAATVANKVSVATNFTAGIDTAEEVIGYSGDAAALQARNLLKGVTATTDTAAYQATVDAVLDSIAHPIVPGQTYTLTTGVDTLVGTTGNDTFNAGTLNTFSAFDSIDGGAGDDTLTILTDAATLPGGLTVANVETINVNTSVSGAFTANASAYTGVKNLSVVSTTQGAGALTVDSASGVTVNSAAATTGAINVGQTTAATGAVTVSKVITGAGAVVGGAINIKGGTTVNVNTSATNSSVGTTVTEGDVTVTGTAATTAVTVKQTATVAAVAAATETATVTWGAFGTAAVGSQSIGGMTITSDGSTTFTAADVATVAGGGTVAGLSITATPTLWTVGAAVGSTTVFTSVTPNANVTNIAGAAASGSGAAPSAVTVAGNAGAAGVTAGAVTITDVNASSATAAGKITSVSLENFGATTINSGALATLTLAGKGTTVTETAGSLTTATATTLALNLAGVTTSGAVTLDADHTTLNIASGTAKNTLATLAASGAKAVNISGDKALVVSAHTLDAAAVITSTNSSGVTFTADLGTGVTFNGGAGADVIGLGASTKASNMGAGDDTVILSGAALGVDGSVAGGDGRDTLSLTAANAITATAGTAVANFSGKVTGFEILAVGATAGAGEIKVASLDNSGWNAIDTVLFTGAVGHVTTVSGLVSGDTVAFEAANSAQTTAAITGAAAATADVLNVSISNSAGINVNTIVAADIETVNFKTDDAATTASGIQHTATLTAAAVKTITVAGDAGLALTNTATTITSFDASGVTKGAVNWTTGALDAAATITGGAGTNTIVATAATKAVTYVGGAGIDDITINNAKDNVINTGAGNDVILVGNGNNTIDAGAGNDQITLGSGANIVNTGAGTNTVIFGTAIAGLNQITLGAGVDTLDFNVVSTAAGYYPSVTGIAAGDKIDFAAFAIAGDEATLGSKITLGGNASFANYLDAAAASNGATVGAEVNWFQYNGNTYLVLDNSATSTYADGVDLVVELVGSVDLSNSTFLSSVVTIV